MNPYSAVGPASAPSIRRPSRHGTARHHERGRLGFHGLGFVGLLISEVFDISRSTFGWGQGAKVNEHVSAINRPQFQHDLKYAGNI